MAAHRTVTLTFDLPADVLKNYDDFSSNQGITVESVAASLCYEHDPSLGYIRFTVEDSEGGQR